MKTKSERNDRGNLSPQLAGAIPLLSLIGVILFLLLPELGLGRRLADGDEMTSKLIREGVFWGIGATVIVYALFIERQPLASIGLKRPTWKTPVFGLIGAVALIASFMLSYAVIFPMLDLGINQEATATITSAPIWFQTLLFLRAAVVEEIIYRGYVIERVEMLTRSRWLAAGVSIIAFTATHLAYWGPAQLIVVVFGAIIFALLYLWRRDLVTNMIAHFIADAVGFAMAAAASQS